MASYRGLLSCCICCGGKDEEWATLDCGHVFHHTCVSEWIRARKPSSCPMCRARTKSARRLVGVESHVEAADEETAHAILNSAQTELLLLREQHAAEAQQVAATIEQQQGLLAAAEQQARRADRLLAKAQAKADEATARERHLQHQLQEAQTVEVSLRQELHAQSERHATSVLRLTSKAKEADFACQEAKRQLAALRLSNKSLTLDQAQSILEGEDSVVAQVLLSRNAELAIAERKLEALQSDVQAARAQGVRDLEAAERRHRAEVAREAAEREKLKRRELQLEYERDSQARRVAELEAELRELRGVLLAVEGGGMGAGQPLAWQQQQRQQQQQQRQQQQQQAVRPLAGAARSNAGQGGGAAAAPGMQRQQVGSQSSGATTAAGVAAGGGTGAMAAYVPVAATSRHVSNPGTASGGSRAATPGGMDKQQPCSQQNQQNQQNLQQQQQQQQQEERHPRVGPLQDSLAALADEVEGDDGALQEQEAPSPQPRLFSFLGGAGSEAPSFLGLGKAASWTGQPQGTLVRQGADGRGGLARHLSSSGGSNSKRPLGSGLGAGPSSKQRKMAGDQQRASGGGDPRQRKLSTFFGGGGASSRGVR